MSSVEVSVHVFSRFACAQSQKGRKTNKVQNKVRALGFNVIYSEVYKVRTKSRRRSTNAVHYPITGYSVVSVERRCVPSSLFTALFSPPQPPISAIPIAQFSAFRVRDAGVSALSSLTDTFGGVCPAGDTTYVSSPKRVRVRAYCHLLRTATGSVSD